MPYDVTPALEALSALRICRIILLRKHGETWVTRTRAVSGACLNWWQTPKPQALSASPKFRGAWLTGYENTDTWTMSSFQFCANLSPRVMRGGIVRADWRKQRTPLSNNLLEIVASKRRADARLGGYGRLRDIGLR